MRRRSNLWGRLLIFGTLLFGGVVWNLTLTGGDNTLKIKAEEEFIINGGVLQGYSGTGENVVIPEGVTEIGSMAFYYCSNVKSITIPESVTKIGIYAFLGCENLEEIMFSEGLVEIDAYAFQYCTDLSMLVFPETLKTIGYGAFEGCNGIKSILFPADIEKVETSAFSFCEGLEEITMPACVQSYSEVFYGCTNVKRVVIAEGTTEIAYQAFYANPGLTNLTSIVIHEGVTKIGNYAFSGCSGLNEIILPDGLNEIGSYAFQNCTGLTEVIIPESVTKINYESFGGCAGLIKVILPKRLQFMSENAFRGCISLTEMTVPDCEWPWEYNKVFANCSDLKKVILTEGTTEIPDSTFSGAIGLTSVIIPKSVTRIGNHAFEGTNILFYVVKGSYAETYMIENNLPYQYYMETEEEETLSSSGVQLSGIRSGELLEVGKTITLTVTSDKKLKETYLIFDRPAGWTAAFGPVYFAEQTCKSLFSFDVASYATRDGKYVYTLTHTLDTMGASEDEFRRRVKLAYQTEDGDASQTEEITFHVYPIPTARVSSSNNNYVNSNYTFSFTSGVEYNNLRLFFDNAQDGSNNHWLSESFELEKAMTFSGLYVYSLTKTINTVGVWDASGQYVRKYRLMDGAVEVLSGVFYVNPLEEVVTPTPVPSGKLGIEVAWKDTKGYLQGELYAEVEETVNLQITITGVSDNFEFTVEIHDNYGNLIKSMTNKSFRNTGSSSEGIVMSRSEKMYFKEAGTVDYIVTCTDSSGAVETARAPMLHVRYKDVGNLEQLKSYAGVSVENFIVGNPLVVQCDNGLSVDGTLYNEYSYSQDGVTRYFFVKESDKTLVTDYDVLQKLWYVKAFRNARLADGQLLVELKDNFDGMMEGLGAYHAGGALSTVVGAGGAAYLTGGQSFAKSLAANAVGVMNIDTLIEACAAAKFGEYYSLVGTLNISVTDEKNKGKKTGLSDFDTACDYAKQLNSLQKDFGATWSLLKAASGVPDGDNVVNNFVSLYTNYFGKAMNGLTLGLSDKAGDLVKKWTVAAGTVAEATACVNDACKVLFVDPITVDSIDDFASVAVKCCSLLPGGKTIGKSNISTANAYQYAQHLIQFMQWSAQINKSNNEIIDYHQTDDSMLRLTVEAYEIVKKEAEKFSEPILKKLSELPEMIFTSQSYPLEFEVAGDVTSVTSSNNAKVEWEKTNGHIKVYLAINEPGTQRVKIRFNNAQGEPAEWRQTVVVYEQFATSDTHGFAFNSHQVGTEEADNPLGPVKPQIATTPIVEVIEGKGGDDYIYPKYGGQRTVYVYYADPMENNGHDRIFDYGGQDTLYIVGWNANISNVKVKFENTAWNVYYYDNLIVTFDSRVSAKGDKDSLVIAAVSGAAIKNPGLFNKNGTCKFENVSSMAIKLPTHAISAYCPIDAYVYDANGEVVQVLRDGVESEEFTEYGMFMVTYNAERDAYEKQIYLYDDTHTVRFVGNDDGTMEYRITVAKEDGSIVTYENKSVEITKGGTWAVDTNNLEQLTDDYGNITEIAHVETIQCIEGELELPAEEPEVTPTEEPEEQPAGTGSSGILFAVIGGVLLIGVIVTIIILGKKKKK